MNVDLDLVAAVGKPALRVPGSFVGHGAYLEGCTVEHGYGALVGDRSEVEPSSARRDPDPLRQNRGRHGLSTVSYATSGRLI